MHGSKNGRFRLADRPADYKRLGIAAAEIAQFEDGQRIGTEKGHYEWWYFHPHLDDGATVVVVFYTKPNVSPNGPLAPRITINLTLPDGRSFEKFLDTRPELLNASKSGCNVRIGANRFVGDLNRYHITATIEEISVDIELTGDVPAWRPKSGHLYFGVEGREKLFAWLPAVPHGTASVRYTVGKEEHRASGSGYHDHNWGDVPMQTLMHNWYWARASVGPYTVIASYITATAAYGYETQIVYMLIADDDAKVSFYGPRQLEPLSRGRSTDRSRERSRISTWSYWPAEDQRKIGIIATMLANSIFGLTRTFRLPGVSSPNRVRCGRPRPPGRPPLSIDGVRQSDHLRRSRFEGTLMLANSPFAVHQMVPSILRLLLALALGLIACFAPSLYGAQNSSYPAFGPHEALLRLHRFTDTLPDFVGPIDGSAELNDLHRRQPL